PALAGVDRHFIAHVVAIWLALALLLVATLLLLRRLMGGLDHPLPVNGMLLVALITVGSAVLVRVLSAVASNAAHDVNHANSPNSAIYASMHWLWSIRWLHWVPTVALPVIALALTIPGSSTVAVLLWWGMIIVEEATAWYLELKPRSSTISSKLPDTKMVLTSPLQDDITAEYEGESLDAADGLTDGSVWQQWTRIHAEDGSQSIQGLVKVPFPGLAETAVYHVAFCPSLAAEPTIEAEQVDGPECRIRVTHAYTYGARFELKRNLPVDQPCVVEFEFAALVNRAEQV
ncbi:MAG: hypothetical protein SGJ20_16560, partial [Planctomycetota bacterium]|nr:hypothetical protein [Planctomycetota bacterium]